jgi:hypothetical protein
MHTREFHLQSGSLFGKKLDQHLPSKRAVGKRVSDFLWDNKVDSLFINDGTSTSYAWCYHLSQWVAQRRNHLLNVWSNNYDVSMQALCEPQAPVCIRIKVAPGEFNFQNCAMLGEDTTAWVGDKSQDKPCLLAVTALDAQVGPCGRGHDAKEIKKVLLLDKAGLLIIVADADKLSQPQDPFLAASESKWQEWLTQKKHRVWVFTDLDPRLGHPYTHRPRPSTPLEWQEENARMLRLQLGDHFVVAQPREN